MGKFFAIKYFQEKKQSTVKNLMKTKSWETCSDHAGRSSRRTSRVSAAATVAPFPDQMVDLSQLLFGSLFAFGANSRVYHGEYKYQAVALKVIESQEGSGSVHSRLEKQFSREVSFLNKQHQNQLPLEKSVAFALDIARGMEYLHSKGVIHRDLKPENILIDGGSFRMKIADFGVSCNEGEDGYVKDGEVGSYRWMAPEMIRDEAYGRKVDVYSFGLLLSEMVSGRIPFEGLHPVQAACAVVNKNSRPALPQECPPPMRALIEGCWDQKQENRPEFWQIVKVLEGFESSLARDGTLQLVQEQVSASHCQKKGFLHKILKLSCVSL